MGTTARLLAVRIVPGAQSIRSFVRCSFACCSPNVRWFAGSFAVRPFRPCSFDDLETAFDASSTWSSQLILDHAHHYDLAVVATSVV